ncbi:hypothetical protein KC721_03255, partial [Candidatus Woesebacteria bacterium]|nr:hypothetical protein [Candidatus Woesebacteria bacterium]
MILSDILRLSNNSRRLSRAYNHSNCQICVKEKHMKALKLSLAGILATAVMLSFSSVVSADT